jgi:hypothetical protein
MSQHNQNLDSLARKLQLEYLTRRFGSAAQAEKTAKRNTPITVKEWLKIAENAISLEADPMLFMDAAFLYIIDVGGGVDRVGGYPIITQLTDLAWCRHAWHNSYPDASDGIDEVPNFVSTPRYEWRIMQRTAGMYFHRIYGKIELTCPETTEELRGPFCSIHPVARVVLSDNDPIVLKRYGRAAHGYLRSHGALKQLIESEGFIFAPLPDDADELYGQL